MLFYASDLLVRNMAAEIVTRFKPPENNVIQNARWLWDSCAIIAV